MSARLCAFAGAPLALLVTLLTATPAHASAIYIYTGNTFNLLSSNGPTAPADTYTTADRVTGFIELANPLAPNLNSLTSVAPVAFSFFDGVNTITNANANPITVNFDVVTNAVGAIVQWKVFVSNFASQTSGERWGSIRSWNAPTVDPIEDVARDVLCGPQGPGCVLGGTPYYTQIASNEGAPGGWTLRTPQPPVPEPSSMLLIGAAIAGFAARRRATRAR